jgi:hypothetical protein
VIGDRSGTDFWDQSAATDHVVAAVLAGVDGLDRRVRIEGCHGSSVADDAPAIRPVG